MTPKASKKIEVQNVFPCCFKKHPSHASSDVTSQSTKDLGETAGNSPVGSQDRQPRKWCCCFKKNRITPVGTDQDASIRSASAAQIYARCTAEDGQEVVVYYPAPCTHVFWTIGRKFKAWQKNKTVGTDQYASTSSASAAQIYAQYTAEDGQEVAVYYPAPCNSALCNIGHKFKALRKKTTLRTHQDASTSSVSAAEIYEQYTAEDGQEVVVYFPAPCNSALCNIGHKFKALKKKRSLARQ